MPVRLIDPTFGTEDNYSMLSDNDGKYWFHYKPLFADSYPRLYEKIISNANQSIDIWDPYMHIQKDCVIFSGIKENVVIRVLTQKSLKDSHQNYPSLFVEKMKQVIPSTKNIKFCLGVINKYLNEKKKWMFHDRFLIINETQVYLVGGSVEWHHTNMKEATGIYKVTNIATSEFINDLFKKYWEQTTKLPEEIQLLHP